MNEEEIRKRAEESLGVAKTTASLQRLWYTGKYGTFGRLTTARFSCFTLELPWRENEEFRSCIPEGRYGCDEFQSNIVHKSLPDMKTMRLRGVPDRSSIIIHQGNTIQDTEGCILVGNDIGVLYNQWAVLNSVDTLRRIINSFKFSSIEIWSLQQC